MKKNVKCPYPQGKCFETNLKFIFSSVRIDLIKTRQIINTSSV